MITIEKNGNAIKFTFDDNGHYLQNGVIEVPINSLSMVIDESDMVTFKRAQSNDIFVSAKYEDFGMTKAELEAWYKNNMVGATGGGGGGSITIDPSLDSGSTNAVANSAITEAVMVDSKVLYDIYPYTSELYTYVPIEAEYLVAEFNPKATNILGSVKGYVEYQSTRYFFSISVTGDTSTRQITNFNINQGASYLLVLMPYGSGKLEVYPRLDVAIKSISGSNVIINVPKNVSGGTASDIIENVVYEELQDVKSDVNVLYSREPVYQTSLQLEVDGLKNNYSKITKSGTTSGYTSILLGENLKGYNFQINVVASGKTVEEDINEELAAKNIYPKDKGIYSKELAVYINQNYASSSDVNIDIQVMTTSIDYSTIRFTYYPSTNTVVTSQESLIASWSYDQSNYVLHVVTNQLCVRSITCNKYIAPINNLTDSSCRIGRVIASYNERSLNKALTVPSQTFAVGGSKTVYDQKRTYIDLTKTPFSGKIQRVRLTLDKFRILNDKHILYIQYVSGQYILDGNLHITSNSSSGILNYNWNGTSDGISFQLVDNSTLEITFTNGYFMSYTWQELGNTYFTLKYFMTVESSDASSFIENEGEILQYAFDNSIDVSNLNYLAATTPIVSDARIYCNSDSIYAQNTFSNLSGVTLSANVITSSIGFDDSLKYNNKIGVYVTGDSFTRSAGYTAKLSTAYIIYVEPLAIGVEFKKNPQYTGTTDSLLTIRRRLNGLDTNLNWAYDSANDTFVPQQEIPSGVTLTYDGITVRITTDEGTISYLQDYDWFADSSNPTDHTCMFQDIYVISNSYKLQDVIDNILSRLSALENNS